MYGDSIFGWIVYILIVLWSLDIIIYQMALRGIFGRDFQTWAVFGKVNQDRERAILKCLAFTQAGKYTPRLKGSNCEYIIFHDTEELNEFEKHNCSNDQIITMKYAFYVDDWNTEEFGLICDRYIYNTITIDDSGEGTISYGTRQALWELKHELMNCPIQIEPSKGFWYRLFHKEVITLS